MTKKLTECSKCSLRGSKKVWGQVGLRGGILFLGEAPGRNEIKEDEVFVGRAGKLLNKGLISIGIDRESVTIINTILCNPPKNRDPSELELECCRKRVLHTIKKMRPKVIIILGKVPFYCLYGNKPKRDDRYRKMYWKKFRTIYVYHPAYFIYNHDEELFIRNFNMIRHALDGENWRA